MSGELGQGKNRKIIAQGSSRGLRCLNRTNEREKNRERKKEREREIAKNYTLTTTPMGRWSLGYALFGIGGNALFSNDAVRLARKMGGVST